MLRNIRIIEDNLKEQLGNLEDLRSYLLNPVGFEKKMPAGVVVVGKEAAQYMGRNMNEEY